MSQKFNDLEIGAWKLAHARNYLRGYHQPGIRSYEDESLAIGLLAKLQSSVEAEQEVLTYLYHKVQP